MSTSPPAGRRLRVVRLDLDLHGIAAGTAEAAARALGPALAHALTSRRAPGIAVDRMDAGRITSPASPDAHGLAAGIARRIAAVLEREGR